MGRMGTAALTARKEVLQPASKMNKFLATIFIVAAVSAEADPYLIGYHGLGYAGYGGYASYGYALPYTAAGYASVPPSASVSIAGLAGAAVPAVAGGYAAAGRYVANSAGVVHVAKREAEADPYVLGYAGYPGYGYAGLGYAGYGGYYGGYGSYSASAGVNIAGHAPAALPAVAGAYAGAGRYCANSAGTIHCAQTWSFEARLLNPFGWTVLDLTSSISKMHEAAPLTRLSFHHCANAMPICSIVQLTTVLPA